MKSIFIVESKNDKFFCERYIKYLNENIFSIEAEIAPPLCGVDDYHCMDGMDKEKLKIALNALHDKAGKESFDKIGILVDMDNSSLESRLTLINDAISESHFQSTEKINSINSFIQLKVDESINIELACYFTNVAQQGNLETVLLKIKNSDSDFADCLSAWKSCIQAKGNAIKESDFNKFWLSIYMTYDQCKGKDKGAKDRKCNFEASLAKDIWDFNSEVLNPFKEFIQLFGNPYIATI